MSKQKGLTFSSAQKTKIVMEVLEGENTLIDIAHKYKTISKTIKNWKNKFLKNASLSFGDNEELVNIYRTFERFNTSGVIVRQQLSDLIPGKDCMLTTVVQFHQSTNTV